MKDIIVRGAREHNLKNLDLDIPRNALTVITGLSGSGKSSLAFDTLYAEGQRRYIESLSTYARQFLEQMEKPDVDTIEGLSPAISIEQKTTTKSVRSTVGTITEIYDYLRLLFSSIGLPHCPRCGKAISRQSVDQIVRRILQLPEGSRTMILAPVVRERKGEFRKLFERFHKEGYVRARVDGKMIYLEEPPTLRKQLNHTIEIVVDRLILSPELRPRIEESVRHALKMAEGLVTVSVIGGDEMLMSERMACIDCSIDVPVLEPRSFSFNSRFGACPVCNGLGTRLRANLNRLVSDRSMPVSSVKLELNSRELQYLFEAAADALCRYFKVSSDTPFRDLPEEMVAALRDGLQEEIPFNFQGHMYESQFAGITRWFEEKLENTSSSRKRQQLAAFLAEGDCPACRGSRLRPEARAVKINDRSIADYSRMSLSDCLRVLKEVRLSEREEAIAGPILSEIRQRLSFLVDIGLDYLTLDRKAISLSAGEAQRVRLATQVGTRLRGVLYVLDEPSIGLHARDTSSLLGALKQLRDLGNTILVVEHDEETIRSADHIIDLGPFAGNRGGHVVAQGSLEKILESNESLTARYLRGEAKVDSRKERRKGNGLEVSLRGVRHNNLKNIDVTFPLSTLITVTGVSGAGKSSLVDEVLYRALARHLYDALLEPGPYDEIIGIENVDKVIEIDQSPIGRTPRSNPATYTGVFTPIRQLFAMLPESKVRGYKPGRFSFNVKGGRCETCLGEGMRKIEMNFLPDVYVLCESCHGNRYNRETLSVKYRGKSIADILAMTIDEAYELMENVPAIERKLLTLKEVGLGYIALGQASTTLSGGEAQRVKLARELSRPPTGQTIYILDEPTTGLHFDDVKKLLDILHSLVDRGNTVIVIEHNLDIIKSADWIIDMGPEGGEAGGHVVACGTPEEVAQVVASHTGRALRKVLMPS